MSCALYKLRWKVSGSAIVHSLSFILSMPSKRKHIACDQVFLRLSGLVHYHTKGEKLNRYTKLQTFHSGVKRQNVLRHLLPCVRQNEGLTKMRLCLSLELVNMLDE